MYLFSCLPLLNAALPALYMACFGHVCFRTSQNRTFTTLFVFTLTRPQPPICYNMFLTFGIKGSPTIFVPNRLALRARAHRVRTEASGLVVEATYWWIVQSARKNENYSVSNSLHVLEVRTSSSICRTLSKREASEGNSKEQAERCEDNG